MHYLFSKKRFKSEINSFSIWTLVIRVCDCVQRCPRLRNKYVIQSQSVVIAFFLHGWAEPVPEIIDPVFAKTSQNARFLLSENERFGLVFVKTGSINSGTALSDLETHPSLAPYLHKINTNRNQSDCPSLGRKNRATQLDPQHRGYFPLPVPRAGYAFATSNVPKPNSGLTQYECGRMKPFLCAEQSWTGI